MRLALIFLAVFAVLLLISTYITSGLAAMLGTATVLAGLAAVIAFFAWVASHD